ncbi:hypothetical protein [Wolbachia endosymbiont of Phyllotreta cruciferae]|uniref:hypothetical protein n=1 Tax=Wolbachia endosymbiont of Phyllotreta cruciferae TaxID=2886377 RepID=UPI00209ED413|nr:hypothetical protein [Wolbachia endosymbiont of Phyllotreta cruciferae]
MSVATRFFQLLCNKAHWDPENSTAKDWIPASNAGMTLPARVLYSYFYPQF